MSSKTFVCRVCGRSFTRISHLRSHSRHFHRIGVEIGDAYENHSSRTPLAKVASEPPQSIVEDNELAGQFGNVKASIDDVCYDKYPFL